MRQQGLPAYREEGATAIWGIFRMSALFYKDMVMLRARKRRSAQRAYVAFVIITMAAFFAAGYWGGL